MEYITHATTSIRLSDKELLIKSLKDFGEVITKNRSIILLPQQTKCIEMKWVYDNEKNSYESDITTKPKAVEKKIKGKVEDLYKAYWYQKQLAKKGVESNVIENESGVLELVINDT
ncbi:hypothetical protein A3715_17620 [Oleiphilus sp. HI0009]|nr:hypothetical protein A3715_17620 [Oleiphilus sp. HI0009]